MANIGDCIFDSCLIYCPATLGATADAIASGLTDADKFALSDSGVTISATPEIRDIPFAGSKERRIKGNQRILKWDVKVEGEVLILNDDILKANLLKKDATETSTKYDKYVPSNNIATDNYINLVIVGKVRGKSDYAMAVVKNCLSYEGFNIETTDKEEGKIAITFEGAYDGEVIPLELYFPKTV